LKDPKIQIPFGRLSAPPLWPGLGKLSKNCPKVGRGINFLKYIFLNLI
jgi:hypothetical protein